MLNTDLIERVVREHGTPFYLYDAEAIRQRCHELNEAFAWNAGFRQHFAVKATPNPHILKLIRAAGHGLDCSSPAELEMARRLGVSGEEVLFTSNNTTLAEFQQASQLGAILNLDAVEHVDKIAHLQPRPGIISARYNPGQHPAANPIMGDPAESKFGCTGPQLKQLYPACQALGIQRFGLHAMLISNELRLDVLLSSVRMLFELAAELKATKNIHFEFINIGGGIGIPYRPEEQPVNLRKFADGTRTLFAQVLEPAGLGDVALKTECGRAITGPFGVLVTRVINRKQSHRVYVGVDATMANLMRPGMFGAYHQISVLGHDSDSSQETVDVVGSLCENNDKFAIQRRLPVTEVGDVLVIHDTGAHGHAMGFQYNGRLRSAEFLAEPNGSFRQIRRAEEIEDLFATLDFSSS